MNDKVTRTLYFVLILLGWIGILWTAYAFLVNAYNATPEVLADPSYFTLLCVSFMSIAAAFILERTGDQAIAV